MTTRIESDDEPTAHTILQIREMVAEARGRRDMQQMLAMARRWTKQMSEATSPEERAPLALCLASQAIVIYEMTRRARREGSS